MPADDRNAVSQGYWELEQRIKRDGVLGGNVNAIHRNLLQADQLHGHVEKPREHARDAGVFEQLAATHAEHARKLAANQQGRNHLDALKAYCAAYALGDDPLVAAREDSSAFQWDALARDVSKWFKTPPGVNCMLGPLDAEAKAPKVRQQRQRRQVAEVSRPEELQNIVESEKQETDRNMEEMWAVLLRGESPVAELVCNHQSFSQTVENLFTLAFLVRDGKVELSHDPAVGMIARKTLTKAQKQQAGSSRGAQQAEEQQQFVIALTQEGWQDMTRMVRKEDCKMKHRLQEGLESQVSPATGPSRAPQGSGQVAAGSHAQGGDSHARTGSQAEPAIRNTQGGSQAVAGGLGGSRAGPGPVGTIKMEGSSHKRRRTDGQ